MLQRFAATCRVLQCVAVRYSVPQCHGYQYTLAPGPRVYDVTLLQCITVCCSVLQCVVLCCGTLQCVDPGVYDSMSLCCSVLQCAAVYCSLLQCVVLCCGVLQCVDSGVYDSMSLCCSVL